ncbi:unnamed protein product [Pleuronectes platessa]|uniref:Uncharacterized protein n=1 Tax=Pleuronectes platessa TaxID=8262 RepID=A0A9N7VLK4_PLEPL|nr:unnamed protein product [Pleuronectes platessa]
MSLTALLKDAWLPVSSLQAASGPDPRSSCLLWWFVFLLQDGGVELVLSVSSSIRLSALRGLTDSLRSGGMCESRAALAEQTSDQRTLALPKEPLRLARVELNNWTSLGTLWVQWCTAARSQHGQ